MSHNPGPWVAVPAIKRDKGAYGPLFGDGLWHIQPENYSATRTPICVVDHADDHNPPTRLKARDDARLIAAAPDLLEALKAFSGDYSDDCYCSGMSRGKCAQCMAKAAIAKAEGVEVPA